MAKFLMRKNGSDDALQEERKMKLQAAIDVTTLNEALTLMEEIHPYVDIIEIGSFLGLIEGFRAVREMKKKYPDKLVLSDAKIVDGGYPISSFAYDSGADIVTTIALTNNDTLLGVVKAAHERGKYAMVDMINVPDLMKRVREVDEMGFDYILLHTPHEDGINNTAPIDAVRECRKIVKRAMIGISGGITVDYMKGIAAASPDWVVVGGALYNAEYPAMTAKALKLYC